MPRLFTSALNIPGRNNLEITEAVDKENNTRYNYRLTLNANHK